MEFHVGCTLEYEVPRPTAFVFLVEAARLERQIVRDERSRVEDPAQVREVPAGRLPLSTLVHLNPSRYCESDRLSLFTERTFGHLAPGHARVGAVCDWVRENVDYVSGTTDEATSAADTLVERRGVCRDFAHLGIALVRALGVPARYVAAYAWRLDPPDFHAVFEAYLEGPDGGAWYVFDATRKAAVDGIVRIGVGRDAGDASFCTPFGEVGFETPRGWVRGPEVGDAPVTVQAISTSTE